MGQPDVGPAELENGGSLPLRESADWFSHYPRDYSSFVSRDGCLFYAICVVSNARFLRCCTFYHSPHFVTKTANSQNAQSCPENRIFRVMQSVSCCVLMPIFFQRSCVSLQSRGGLPEDQWPSLCDCGCWPFCRPSAPTSAAFN